MHMTGIGAGSTCTHMPMHVRVRVRARSGEAADAVGDKWTEGSVLQTYPEAVRAVLAEADGAPRRTTPRACAIHGQGGRWQLRLVCLRPRLCGLCCLCARVPVCPCARVLRLP